MTQATGGLAPAARGTPVDLTPPAAVRRHLDQLLLSPDFDAAPRSREFLRFVVEETLAGRGDELDQVTIATRVFDRREDFDPLVDPIVRIQAGRLRRSLERYYLISRNGDPLRIELPRGAYVPVFRRLEEGSPVAPQPAPGVVPDDDWPTVTVSRFDPSGPGPEQQAVAANLNEELILELGRYRDVRPLLQSEMDGQDPSRRAGLRFLLGGRLRETPGGLRVTARLLDPTTGEQIWGDDYHTVPAPGRWSGSLADIARVIAARVGAEEGVVVQRLAGERRTGGSLPLTPYGAILRSYEFFLMRDPATLASVLEALRQAVQVDPGCGLAWSRLARVYVANHTFEVTAIPTPMEDAIAYAQHGVRLDPTSRRARCGLAAALIVVGELAAARREMDEALRLNPDSLVYLEMIGFMLTAAGDWEGGPARCREARERNPHCLPHGSFALWMSHLHRGEIEDAYLEALGYRDPNFFWRSVMRASCLGLLGRLPEAETEVAAILRAKADFPERGRILIGHIVKSPDVMSRIADGLSRAGLELA
jgi:adenylate cyclase